MSHKLLSGVLALLLVLSLALNAWLGYSVQQNNERLDELVDAMNGSDNGSEIAETDSGSETSDTSANGGSLLSTFEGFGNLPTFHYPSDMHIAIQDGAWREDGRTTLYLSDQPVWFCEGCDGRRGIITMQVETGDDNLEDLEKWGWVSGYVYEDSESASLDNGGTVVTRQYSVTSEIYGSHDSWINRYRSGEGERYVITEFADISDSAEEREIWEIVSNSLNFDHIK